MTVSSTARYLFCITAPTTYAWSNTGPYDTYILEAKKLTGPFSLVTYMPRFGMQAYFVSLPSAWMGQNDGSGPEPPALSGVAASGTSDYDAVL